MGREYKTRGIPFHRATHRQGGKGGNEERTRQDIFMLLLNSYLQVLFIFIFLFIYFSFNHHHLKCCMAVPAAALAASIVGSSQTDRIFIISSCIHLIPPFRYSFVNASTVMMMMLMAGDSWKSSNMTFRIPACAFNHILVAVWGSIWSRSVWMYSIDR